MSLAFFVRRYLLVFAIAAVVIGIAQFLKGRTPDYSIREAIVWGAISALVYTCVLAYKLRHLRAPVPEGTGGDSH
jgi:hypothetical protein